MHPGKHFFLVFPDLHLQMIYGRNFGARLVCAVPFIPYISIGGDAIISQVDIGNAFTSHFSHAFNSNNYIILCLDVMKTTQALPPNFASRLAGLYWCA
jgi:hypothetical protein